MLWEKDAFILQSQCMQNINIQSKYSYHICEVEIFHHIIHDSPPLESMYEILLRERALSMLAITPHGLR